ncbi:unnamed protein product [Candida verbasci]|uniref:inorganic diphosphatase n=1 Tax=Candida verbasci TaxID=1227364 RepID=A0A9W4XKP5_9ASCO|nr:unnamed protein product [Candida verbasci]
MTSKSSPALARLSLTSQHLSSKRLSSTRSTMSSHLLPNFDYITQGTKYTTSYENYLSNSGSIVSYFHDVPLDLDVDKHEATFICEIPRWTNGKFEINTELEGNPITQDVKDDQVRFVRNLFPYHGYIHNYGCFPQTWEDPTVKHLEWYGDNDPLDVCEVGDTVLKIGEIKRVKILGSLAMIDDGEMDWKVIVVDINDPLAKEVDDIHHLVTKRPGLLETTRQWFRDYKLPDGNPQTEFAYNGRYRNATETIEVIKECNKSWKDLIMGKKTGDDLPNIKNTAIRESPGYVERFDIKRKKYTNREAPIPEEIDKSFFISKD